MRIRRLELEVLEQRDLLTTIIVDSLQDNFDPATPLQTDGVISLREAVTAANLNTAVGDAPAGTGIDTIVFAAALNNGVVTLDRSLGELVVNDSSDLTVDASALNSLTIDGDDGSPGSGIRIFRFDDPTSGNSPPPLVRLVGLTLTEGEIKDTGGAILSEARLVIEDSILINNTASDDGGAIFVSVNGGGSEVLRIENSTITSNETEGSGGGIAVFSGTAQASSNDSIIVTNGTTISNNRSGAFREGGGIFAELHGSTLTIDGGTAIIGNESLNGGGVYMDLNDGAAANLDGIGVTLNESRQGGGVYADINSQSIVSVASSVFVDNVAQASGVSTKGGGLFVSVDTSDVFIADSTFVGNESSEGGGLHAVLTSQSAIEVDSSSFEFNESGVGGGFFVDVNDSDVDIQASSFVDNSAMSTGGGLQLKVSGYAGSVLNVSESDFTGNQAEYHGGGLYARLKGVDALTITESAFHLNVADSDGDNSGNGGGIYCQAAFSDSMLEIRDSTISENSSSAGGGMFAYIGDGGEGGRLSVLRTTVEQNLATSRGGGVSLQTIAGALIDVKDSTISGNKAGIALGSSDGLLPNSGGGVYAELGTYDYSLALGRKQARLAISGTIVDGNTAGRHGGGVAVAGRRLFESTPISSASGGQFALSNSTISGNQAGHTTAANVGGTGGGVHLHLEEDGPDQVNAELTNVTVTTNIADTGAGIYSQTPASAASVTDLSLRNTIVSGNERHDQVANNFWGSINAGASQYNLISDAPTSLDNRFEDHLTQSPIGFANLGAGNLNNGGSNIPGLAPLADNGGWTKTHAVLSTSDALDAGLDSLAVEPFTAPGVPLVYDQRGLGSPRILDGDGVAGARIDIGSFELGDGPTVSVVSIGSSFHSNQGFLQPGVNQLKTVPVGKPNKFIVLFSEPVMNVQDALTIERLKTGNTYTATWDSTNGSVVTWLFSNDSPDAETFADQLRFTISDTVTDAAGNGLDGEWDNALFIGDTAATPTYNDGGDGINRGNFDLYLTFLPGDFNQDNVVDGADFQIWSANKFQSGKTFGEGDADGDGDVDGYDFLIWNRDAGEIWTHLPSGAEPLLAFDFGEVRLLIDQLIVQYEIVIDGQLNEDLPRETWDAFARDVDLVLRKWNPTDDGDGSGSEIEIDLVYATLGDDLSLNLSD